MDVKYLLILGLMMIMMMLPTEIAAQTPDPLQDFFEDEWEDFKITYNRFFANDFEEQQRFHIFIDNQRLVLKHNADFLLGRYTFDVTINKFGDMTAAQVAQQLNGFNRTQQVIRVRGYPFGNLHHLSDPQRFRLPRAAGNEDAAKPSKGSRRMLPAEINWVTLGAVGPVLDQGKCGSCWAFSAVGALEAQHFRKTGELVQLSVQQLVDCARENGNNGCDGGVMEEAYEYVQQNGGLAAAADYPFEEEQHDCAADDKGKNSVAMNTGFKRVPTRNEKRLMEAVARNGPVAVAIDASHSSFLLYKGGVYYEPMCAAGRMDHGVLVVGYGTDAATGEEYWLVKNSWGTNWGEDGYIRMARNKMNNCCIACYGAYPLV